MAAEQKVAEIQAMMDEAHGVVSVGNQSSWSTAPCLRIRLLSRSTGRTQACDEDINLLIDEAMWQLD